MALGERDGDLTRAGVTRAVSRVSQVGLLGAQNQHQDGMVPRSDLNPQLLPPSRVLCPSLPISLPSVPFLSFSPQGRMTTTGFFNVYLLCVLYH